jgi:hypothetical protein
MIFYTIRSALYYTSLSLYYFTLPALFFDQSSQPAWSSIF